MRSGSWPQRASTGWRRPLVDLVKIRKKAKKNSELPAGETPAASTSVQPDPQTDSQAHPGVIRDEKPDTSMAAAMAEPPVVAPPSGSKLDRFKEAAGRRRDIAAAQEETVEEERLELLTFVVAGEQYAVEIEKIVEIVRPRPVTHVPNSDESIVGIVSLRGTIVTLLDVRQKLRHSTRLEGGDPRIIVVDRVGEIVGFEVDRVLRVVKIVRESIEPHPVVHASEQDEAVRGVFRQGTALTILLDLDKLLDVA